MKAILLSKTTAARNGVALSYQSVRAIFSGSCFCGYYIMVGAPDTSENIPDSFIDPKFNFKFRLANTTS